MEKRCKLSQHTVCWKKSILGHYILKIGHLMTAIFILVCKKNQTGTKPEGGVSCKQPGICHTELQVLQL